MMAQAGTQLALSARCVLFGCCRPPLLDFSTAHETVAAQLLPLLLFAAKVPFRFCGQYKRRT